jgi:hypothetical protein
VTRGWNPDAVTNYAERLHHHNTAVPADVAAAFALIDGKVAGLLTHVSLMIAGLGLVAPLVASSDVEIGIVVLEIAIYLLIAVGCLRCLSVFHSRDFDCEAGRMRELLTHELILRRELYSLCIRASILFTLVVFLLLPVLYFYKPVRLP